jgi:phenylacetic acid degradation operon negative regulatory protein
LSIDSSNIEKPGNNLVVDLLDDQPVNAASFIVTVYGDVVVPRGGVVWIGNLIEICGEVGISETLVRTAVSRLVAAGQLVGEKSGKRSFYRLTPAAHVEFSLAAKQLFSPDKEVSWRFVYLSGAQIEEDVRHLERNGYARVASSLMVGCRPLPPTNGANRTVFEASVDQGEAFLRSFANEYTDLGPLSAAYRRFIDRYSRLKNRSAGAKDALALRLLLVHDFRYIVLRDPNLPSAALPAGWAGDEARRLFSSLYRAWSGEADKRVGLSFVNASGSLSAQTEETRNRGVQLRAYES